MHSCLSCGGPPSRTCRRHPPLQLHSSSPTATTAFLLPAPCPSPIPSFKLLAIYSASSSTTIYLTLTLTLQMSLTLTLQMPLTLLTLVSSFVPWLAMHLCVSSRLRWVSSMSCSCKGAQEAECPRAGSSWHLEWSGPMMVRAPELPASYILLCLKRQPVQQ